MGKTNQNKRSGNQPDNLCELSLSIYWHVNYRYLYLQKV